ncbi:MAG: hypothetical protein IPJ56_02225 [Gemmatimonadetes bacterium]|nr:hypothetical protein [Gemmatimonadota bacterium]
MAQHLRRLLQDEHHRRHRDRPVRPQRDLRGSGEHAIRGQSSTYGDGVYKSTDQGKTWVNVGLAATRQISAVRVHPNNPDVVYVAAQGDRWKGTAERGIYRSTDGGKTWLQVLKGENATSGAAGLSMDPTNPRILYAAMWDHQRTPWMVRSGGPGSGIWKSNDGGDSWTRLHRRAPQADRKPRRGGLAGKSGTRLCDRRGREGRVVPQRRRGKTWRLLSEDRLIQTRSWYYIDVIADPQNADVVWVMNAPVLKSIDGGRTFAVVNAMHGDNHGFWINPTNSNYVANANDGGGSISLDGGKSWSTQDNQPTAQFYHVTVDDDFPYKLYSGQQDNSSVIIQSRSDGFMITEREWNNGPGCESANIGVSGKRSRYVYGGCYQGLIDELDQENGLSRDIMAYPEMNLTEPTDKTKYRFNWTAPIVVSMHDENVIYHGGNVLLRSRDRGQSWAPASGDLTKNDKSRQGWGGGPITNEGAGGEVYGTIFVIEESPHDAKTMYVGTDDGNVQLTKDGGGDVDQRDAANGGRWVGERARGVAARPGHGVRGLSQGPRGRPGAVHLPLHRLRQDVDDAGERAARRRAGARGARGSRAEGADVRRDRDHGLHLVRRRGPVAALRRQSSGCPGDRPRGAPRRPDRLHRRARVLDPR